MNDHHATTQTGNQSGGQTILTYADVTAVTGIKITSLRKRLCTGSMPKPDMRVGGSPVWYLSTLNAWLKTAAPGARPQNRKENRKTGPELTPIPANLEDLRRARP